MSAAAESWPWHDGEREAQARAGVHAHGGAIRDHMPDQHRTFFAQLPFVVVATLDRARDGAPRDTPIATLWTGAPGFVTSPDPQTLALAIARDPGDPTAAAFTAGAPFGLLGIELHTRRRNRANGTITRADADGVTVAVHQSFGNCPQYIHPRALHAAPAGRAPAIELAQLDAPALAALARADTFFVASAARVAEPTGGVDVSHRGGPAGFVRTAGDVLTIPDYRGNRYFNTLGNLVSNPRAGLVFADLATGDLLHLQGDVEIAWDAVDALPGAERLWRLHVDRAWRRPGALALRSEP